MDPWIWQQPGQHAVVLSLALTADRLWGEAPATLHPVVWLGRLVTATRWLAPPSGDRAQLLWGIAAALALPALGAGLAWGLVQLPVVGGLAAVFLTSSSLAIRALGDGGEHVGAPLLAGDLDGARAGLSWLCSRPASALSESELAGAAVESLAENASDSAVAPIFWFVVAGVPGVVAYRVVNTLDAMIGYRGELEYLGKASARLDDLLNLLPARLTALLLLLGGGRRWRDGLRIGWRDASATASPNAGWPMAVMAGLLGIELSKAGHYCLGAGQGRAEAAHVHHAWVLSERAMLTAGWLAVALLVGATLRAGTPS